MKAFQTAVNPAEKRNTKIVAAYLNPNLSFDGKCVDLSTFQLPAQIPLPLEVADIGIKSIVGYRLLEVDRQELQTAKNRIGDPKSPVSIVSELGGRVFYRDNGKRSYDVFTETHANDSRRKQPYTGGDYFHGMFLHHETSIKLLETDRLANHKGEIVGRVAPLPRASEVAARLTYDFV